MINEEKSSLSPAQVVAFLDLGLNSDVYNMSLSGVGVSRASKLALS